MLTQEDLDAIEAIVKRYAPIQIASDAARSEHAAMALLRRFVAMCETEAPFDLRTVAAEAKRLIAGEIVDSDVRPAIGAQQIARKALGEEKSSIPNDLQEVLRLSAQAQAGSHPPQWRSQGFQLAEAAMRAAQSTASDADRRAYLYALATFAGRAMAEIHRITRQAQTLDEDARASA